MAPVPELGIPSTSVSVLLTVSVWFWVGVPEIVTEPLGASLTLATAFEAALLTASAVPCESV